MPSPDSSLGLFARAEPPPAEEAPATEAPGIGLDAAAGGFPAVLTKACTNGSPELE